MKKYWLLSLCLLLAGLPLVACTPPSAPTPEPKTPAASNQVSSASWEQNWADILAAGKKEGVVTAYVAAGTWGPAESRIALTEAFRKKFGIDLEFAGAAAGAEMNLRLKKEKSAGLNIADVIATGPNSLLGDLKPAGLLGDIEPLLLLPEVTDAKVWGGTLPFIDKDKKVLGTILQIQRTPMYNTELIKKGEINSYKDLLKPQYKGKLIMGDPTTGGPGVNLFASMALSMWNLEEAKDFLWQLVKQQEVVISRDSRLVVEAVARGKYAFSLGPVPAVVKEFLQSGSPIDVAMYLKEGTYAITTTTSVSATPAHPNAARVFINWLLTKEGQTIFSRTLVSPSLRTDVSPEGIDPRWVPQPGEKIFMLDEESYFFASGPLPGILTDVIRQAQK